MGDSKFTRIRDIVITNICTGRDKDKKTLIADIKNKLQYPKTTLQLIAELKAGRRKNVPIEFIQDALKAIEEARAT